MSALGSLVVKLALEYAEYTRGLDRSDQAALEFARRAQRHFDAATKAGSDFFDGIAKRAVGAVAAIVTVGAAVEAMNRSINDLAGLDDLAQKTGASVETLSRLQQVARTFDHDFGSVDGALSKLARGMTSMDEDSSKTFKALKALGVSARDAAGNLRDPAEVLVDVAKGLQKFEDGAGKAALVTDLFSKAGVDLIPFLNDTAESVDGFSARSQEAAAKAAMFQDRMGMLRNTAQEFATDITVGALPALNDLMGAFIDVSREASKVQGEDVSSWADDIAVNVARLADVLLVLPRLFSAVSGSAKVVGADLKMLSTIAEYANPIGIIKARMDGTTATAEISKAVDERNKVLAEGNQRWVDLWYKPANELEQAMLRRIADRQSGKSEGDASKPAGAKLNYSSGAAEKEKSDYESLNKAVRERLALAQAEVTEGRKLSEAEKEISNIRSGVAAGTVHLTSVQADGLVAILQQVHTMVKAREAGEAVQKMYDDLAEASRKKIEEAANEATENERLVETFGKTKAQIEALELARLKEQLAQKSSKGLTLDEIADLEKMIAARQRNAAALDTLEQKELGKKALGELDAFLDPSKAQTFGEALKEAFGSAGDSASKLVGVLDGFSKRQADFTKQRTNAATAVKNGLITEARYQQDLLELSRQETKGRLAGYGDMSAAAAGFFGEQSKGYQALMAVSKVFHAAELAMTLAELVPKGIAAVLNQANGDPYTAFARMAAMAAAVAALGVAIGGVSGGGGRSAADVQKQQGAGSVFGDSTAKSDSIRRSIEQLKENSDGMLPINKSMLTALQNIESAMSGLTNLVVRTTGLTDGTNMGIETGTTSSSPQFDPVLGAVAGGTAAGAYLGSMAGAFMGPLGIALGGVLGSVLGGVASKVASLWGKTTQTIIDSGLQYGGSLRDLQAGDGFQQYASVDTTKKSMFGLKKKTSNRVEVADLNDELSNQFALIFSNLDLSLQAASVALGGSAEDVAKVLDGLTLQSTKVSLKDLKGSDLTDALNSVISKSMDEIAQAAFPQFEAFRKVGEGYAETVMRLAGDYAKLDAILAAGGMTFGATGIASVAARERLIELTGGLDELASQSSSFVENYFSKAEQLAPIQKYVTEQMAAMGLQSIDTREKFKNYVVELVNSGALLTEEGAKRYADLMAIESLYAKTHAATVDRTRSEQEIADERTALQERLDAATLSAVELEKRRHDAIAEQNRALDDQVVAAEAAKAAADAATAAAEALAATNADYQARIDAILKARMSEAEVRALETAGLDDSTIALYDRLKALESEKAKADALAAVNKTYQSQIDTILKSRMSEAELRAVETAGMDDSTIALYDRLKALQAEQGLLDSLKAGANSALAVLSKSIEADKAGAKAQLDAQLEVLNARKEAAEELAELELAGINASLDAEKEKNDRLRKLGDALKSTLDGMRMDESAATSRRVGQAQITQALLLAKTGGGLPDVDALKDSLNAVSQPSADLFDSFEDYVRDFYVTAGKIADLNDLTGSALTTSDTVLDVSQKQLEQMQKDQTAATLAFDREIKLAQDAYDLQVAQLDQTLAAAQAQLDVALGNNIAVMSVEQAVVNFQTKITALLEGMASPLDKGGVVAVAPATSVTSAASTSVRVEVSTPVQYPTTSAAAGSAADNSAVLAALGKVQTELEQIRRASANTASSTGQLAQQFELVSEGGSAVRVLVETD